MKNKILLGITIVFIVIIIIILLLSNKYLAGNNTAAPTKYHASLKQPYIRKMSAIGQFYPDDTEKLKSQMNTLLSNTEKLPKNGKLRILIVPHAGLSYSGQTAAWGYAQVKDENYTKIIIISSDHKKVTDSAYIMTEGEWETSFGNIKIDIDLANNLLDKNHKIISSSKAHEDQHVIEMETIFTKYFFKDAKIVPIILGANISDDTIQSLSYKIAKIFDDSTLLIISTDLSHYPSYEDAKKVDANTIDSFLSLNTNTLNQTAIDNSQQGYQNLQTSACGLKAMEIAIRIAKITNISDFSLIHYSNSADYSNDKSRVVGYGAIGGWSIDEPKIYLSESAKEEIIALAKNTVNDYLMGRITSNYKPRNEILNIPMGAFVTLTKNNNLRGCMGEFDSSLPLYKIIQNTAILSASKDPRFKPVSIEEFDQIKFEISVLSPPSKADTWEDIISGKHGVKIELNNHFGTFLPQVATDNNWDSATFLENLCTEKLRLSKNCYQDKNAKIYTYTAQVFGE